jgi:Alpha/beta hydrolase
VAIGTAQQAAVRDGDRPLAGALARLRTRHVLFFNPGSDTTLATFFSRGAASPGGGGEALAAQARRLEPVAPGERLAVIAWLGYPAPAMLSPGVMTSGDAGQGAQALRPLVTALARHGSRVALLCHSYGSVVCGLAAPHPGVGAAEPVPAADGPDQRGVPLDKGVPGLLVAICRAGHQVIDRRASTHGRVYPVHGNPPLSRRICAPGWSFRGHAVFFGRGNLGCPFSAGADPWARSMAS